jgi:large subunit ribosomal protein L31
MKGFATVRENIHPKWFADAKVVCMSCGTTWTVGSTKPQLSLDICSACHPFYTGEQRIVDTEGQVDRFMKRLEVRDTRAAEAAKKTDKVAVDLPISELSLGRQYTELLGSNGIKTAGDFIAKLEEGGDDAILEIRGIGRKVLTDAKKRLRARGYTLPAAQEA